MDSPPLVVAEIGINHGGSLSAAKQIVDAAISAGITYIKHQTHIPDAEMSREALHVKPGNADKSIYEVIASCALSEYEEHELLTYVQSKGGIFFSSPFSREAAYRLQDWGVPLFKVGSGECNNFPLLKILAGFGRPVILSTGMNHLSDIRIAYEILTQAGCDVALLHTTNLYPTKLSHVRLGGVSDLLEAFPRAIVGLSDHSTSNSACLGATALGAQILERHFTDSKLRQGPDIVCSMDSDEATRLISQAAEIRIASGGKREPIREEEVTSNFAFASCVSTKKLEPGTLLSPDNIWVKRPGNGDFSAAQMETLWGRKVVRVIEENTQIKIHDIT